MWDLILENAGSGNIDINLDGSSMTVPAGEVEINVIKGNVEAFEIIYAGNIILNFEESTFPSLVYDMYANVQEAYDSVLTELTAALA